jgi:membrane-associated phospholipid phosphatase
VLLASTVALLASPYDVDLARDLSINGAAGATWLGLFLARDSIVEPSCPPCERGDVLSVDRVAIDERHKALNPAANVGLGLMLAAPVGIALGEAGLSREAADDVLVEAQAVLSCGALTEIVKLSVQRPRPFLYRNDQGAAIHGESDSYESFWSGHTATAFSTATATAFTFQLRHPRSRARWAVWAVALLAASTEGTIRVLAGDHYPTDVLAGAAAGTAFGLGIPWLHARREPVAVALAGHGVVLGWSFP